ncbi:MAG: sigma-70 family RNA polymerase sigma factor [Planctomycetes bacterium]|nr:sigma-70 family RNA polymerase sigma factor [Planctomycetota bacterium]
MMTPAYDPTDQEFQEALVRVLAELINDFNEHDVEDCMQDACAIIWMGITMGYYSFEHRGGLIALLRKITRNLLIHRTERRKLEQKGRQVVLERMQAAPSEIEQKQKERRLELIDQAMKSLPEEDRDLLTLSPQEAMKKLSIKHSAYYERRKKAGRDLRELVLEAEEDDVYLTSRVLLFWARQDSLEPLQGEGAS